MSQFDKTVIPGEQNYVERDPESRKLAENHSGSRLASRSAGFGRDDELRKSLRWGKVREGVRGKRRNKQDATCER